MNNPLDNIHETSMMILETIGVRIHHPELLEELAQRGIRRDGDSLYFTRDQVASLIAMAPPRIRLHAADPAYDMELGGDRCYYGAGYGCPAILDREGVRRNATFADYLTFLKLVESSPAFCLNGGVLVQPWDIAPEHSAPLMLRAALLHSEKCLMGMPGHRREVEVLMEMMAIAKGGEEALMAKPWLITLVNVTSPLQFDRVALETMAVCARYRQPVILSPGPIAGATGPVTLAGNLAMANAEALAGVAITQLMGEGTPVVYGLQATTADMATGGISIGSPGFSLETMAGARLAKRYGLPCRSGGAGTDACCVNAQSGYESMMALMVSRREKVNLMLHSAGILDGYGAMGVEKFITDLEMISMVEYLAAGYGTAPDDLALSVIEDGVAGTAFLAHPHTLKNCRTVPWLPTISWRGALKGRTGREVFDDRIDAARDRLLHAYHPPHPDPDRRNQLDSFLESVGIPVAAPAGARPTQIT